VRGRIRGRVRVRVGVTIRVRIGVGVRARVGLGVRVSVILTSASVPPGAITSGLGLGFGLAPG